MDKLFNYREQIFLRVHELLVAVGFQGLRHEDVAAHAGISRQDFLHCFPDKTVLVRAFLARQWEVTDTWILGVVELAGSPLLRLQCYVDEWATSLRGSHGPFYICALLAREMPVLPEEVASDVRTYFNRLLSWLASTLECGRRQGALRLAYPPEVESHILTATIQGAILSAKVYDDDRIFIEIAAMQMRRLTQLA